MPRPRTPSARIRVRIAADGIESTLLERARDTLKKVLGADAPDPRESDAAVPLRKLAAVRRALGELGIRPRLIPDHERAGDEEEVPDEVPLRRLGARRVVPSELAGRQRAAQQLHRIRPARVSLPRELLSYRIEPRMRWWKRDPVDSPVGKPGEVELEERPITLLDGRKVRFIRRTETDPDARVPRKRFFLREEGGRVVNADEVAPELLPLFGAESLPEKGPVVVCEGIPAAEALLERGHPAVATLTGALRTPVREALAVLRGRDVILWPDNDDVGVAHMAAIAAELEAMGIPSKLLRWRDGPHQGDAADLVGADGDPRELLERAEDWDPELEEAASRPPRLAPPTSPRSLRSTRRLAVEREELTAWPTAKERRTDA